MKKKYIVLIVAAIFLLGGVVGFFGLSHTGERYMLSDGNIIFSKTGDAIFVGKNGPVVMRDASKKGELFADFKDGDGVKIIHGFVNETYPGQSAAYFVMKSASTMGEEAEEQIKELKELGWLTKEEFPEVTKAILYKKGEPREIEPDDKRLKKTLDYIMESVNYRTYAYVKGVLENEVVESHYKSEDCVYMILELNSDNNERFSRYDRAIISRTSVIFIDSDSVSYHGEGNPFNECITPYSEDEKFIDGKELPEILPQFFG